MSYLTDLANTQVPITLVCRKLGTWVPDFDEKSIKTYCPFGRFYHSDGGTTPAFRVYPGTNSVFCFAGCGYFSCVTLWASARDVHYEEAARVLLDLIGYRPRTLTEQWQDALEANTGVDQESLTEALRTWCATQTPKWALGQYHSGVSYTLAKYLDIVPHIKTAEDAEKWLEAAKLAMAESIQRNLC